jgi:hypothetical protein
MLGGMDIGDGLLIIHHWAGRQRSYGYEAGRARHPPVPGLWHMRWLWLVRATRPNASETRRAENLKLCSTHENEDHVSSIFIFP